MRLCTSPLPDACPGCHPDVHAKIYNARMLSQERVLELIGRIYDAAADPRLWDVFLDQFAETVGATATGLIHYDLARPRAQSAVFVRMDPASTRDYLDYYSTVNPWLKSYKYRLNLDGPESITVSEQLLELSELEKTEYYNDFLVHADIVHQFAGMIAKSEVWGSAFTCLRPRDGGAFEPGDVALLRLLFPHLRRAQQFERTMAELDGAHRAGVEALDRLPIGIVLLDANGLILESNHAAGRILQQHDGLTARKDGLVAATAAETRAMRSLIAAAAHTGTGKGVCPGGALSLDRPSGKRPLSVVIMPASPRAFPPEARRPAVLLFVSDPENTTPTLPGTLVRLYRFTAAEARLAECLMRGTSLVDTAAQLGITHNTARTHLQRIYDKTGTNHQGDLARMLLTGVAGLVPPSPD